MNRCILMAAWLQEISMSVFDHCNELPSERRHTEATGDSLVPLQDATHSRLKHIVEPVCNIQDIKARCADIASALGHNDPNRVLQFLLDEDH